METKCAGPLRRNLMGFGCAHGGWKHSLLISVMRSIIQNRPDRRGDPVFHKIVLFSFIMSPIVAVADLQMGGLTLMTAATTLT